MKIIRFKAIFNSHIARMSYKLSLYYYVYKKYFNIKMPFLFLKNFVAG
jgi:hypothetical protein